MTKTKRRRKKTLDQMCRSPRILWILLRVGQSDTKIVIQSQISPSLLNPLLSSSPHPILSKDRYTALGVPEAYSITGGRMRRIYTFFPTFFGRLSLSRALSLTSPLPSFLFWRKFALLCILFDLILSYATFFSPSRLKSLD